MDPEGVVDNVQNSAPLNKDGGFLLHIPGGKRLLLQHSHQVSGEIPNRAARTRKFVEKPGFCLLSLQQAEQQLSEQSKKKKSFEEFC
jgi:hypothetical protein